MVTGENNLRLWTIYTEFGLYNYYAKNKVGGEVTTVTRQMAFMRLANVN